MSRFELWAARSAAFLLAALAAGSAAYWLLHWPDAAVDARRDASVATMSVATTPPDATHLTSLLGGAKVADNPAQAGAGQQRWRLVGVVAGAQGRGAALIAVDDRPAKSYTVGSRVAEGWYLKAVAPRRAMLAPTPGAAATLTLELPRAAQAALSPAGLAGDPAGAAAPQSHTAP